MNGRQVGAELDRVVRDLMVSQPYYAYLCAGMARTVVEDAAMTLALRPSGDVVELVLGQDYFGGVATTPRARQAALLHELLHLSFRHPLRGATYPHRPWYELACDLVVNQCFDASALPDAITLDDLAELELAPDRDVSYYYEQLVDFWHESACDSACEGGQRSAAQACLSAWCEGRHPAQASHRHWRDFDDLSSAARALMTLTCEKLLEQAARRARSRCWGDLPGRLREELEALLQGPAIPWQRILRLFVASNGRTRLHNSIARVSRRYGTRPGIRVRRRHRVVVAVDTSGSVDAQEMSLFFTEIHALWRSGTEIEIFEADTHVRCAYAYRGHAPGSVQGRGGTCFDDVLARANDQRIDALVYFTDGHADAPTVAPRMPVLWVLTANGMPRDEATHLPGRHVQLPAVLS
jgi:predicted metal-dependent peptidase